MGFEGKGETKGTGGMKNWGAEGTFSLGRGNTECHFYGLVKVMHEY